MQIISPPSPFTLHVDCRMDKMSITSTHKIQWREQRDLILSMNNHDVSNHETDMTVNRKQHLNSATQSLSPPPPPYP